MNQEKEIVTLDDSFKFYRNQDQDSIIVFDSEDESSDQDESQDSLVHEKHVIKESLSPSSSSVSINSSSVDILEDSQGAIPKTSRIAHTTQKLDLCDISNGKVVGDSFCLAPDSDDESISQQNLSKKSLHAISIVNDSSSSISSKSDLESPVSSRDISTSDVQIIHSSSSNSLRQEFSALSIVNESSSSISSKSGVESSRSSSDISSYNVRKNHSNISNSSRQEFDFLQAKPVSGNINNSKTHTFLQKSRRDRSSNESNSSTSSVKILDLDISSHSRGSNSSYSSLKERSPSLSEKQKFARKILDLGDNIKKKKMVLRSVDLATLPDRGVRLQLAITSLEKDLKRMQLEYENMPDDEPGGDLPKPQSAVESTQPGTTQVNSYHHGAYANTSNLGVIRGMDSVTMDALKNLHDSLKTCPAEDVMAEQPSGLKISLMPHQCHGLAWMLWREQQIPSGGILADDMGLGKTLSMISLILKHKELTGNKKNSELNGSPKGGTLIVCPTSLLGQWKNEVERRCRQSALTLCIHHGTDRSTSLRRLLSYDIVITTYGIVMKECESIRKKTTFKDDGPLHLIDWTRIILDEAHVVRNYKSQTSQAASCLKGTYRWALTGTPIHNKELDLFALMVFIRCSPFDKYLTWRRWVDNKTAAGTQRMNMLMKSLMLRRTKDQLQSKGSLVCLPSREEHHVEIFLDSSEQTVYDQILILSKTLFAKFLDQHAERTASQFNDDGTPSESLLKPSPISKIWPTPFLPGSALAAMQSIQQDRVVKSHHLLVLLLRLRQICCHPALIQSMLDAEDCKEDGIVDDSGLDVDLISQLNAINLLDNNEEKQEENEMNNVNSDKNPLTLKNPVFRADRPSSKLNALLQCLEENVLHRQDKAVIVSQWTSMLDLIGNHLEKKKIKYQLLTGAVPLKARMDVIESFNNNQRGPQVLLLSLKAGGVGLNLIGGNHLMLVDLHWNPQLEAQACDRIYRVGQKKGVHVYRFVCKHTVEERIHELQEKKLSLAESVLTGAKNPQSNKLTLEDLKTLFSSS